MRLATWNVNSIRSRHGRVHAWLERRRPDIALLQETKCSDAAFAELGTAFEALGYAVAHHGRDQWNGVAILSRVGLDDVRRGLPGANRPPFDEPRVVSAVCAGIDVHSLYAPNGRELDDPHYLFKLVWLERLRGAIRHDRPTIVAGDFNVAPSDVDIYDPARWRRRTHASPPERAAIRTLVDDGLVDVGRSDEHEPGRYTWWSYRPGQFERNRGLRIDLALCSTSVADRVSDVWVDVDERTDDGRSGEKPSDHAPVIVDITD